MSNCTEHQLDTQIMNAYIEGDPRAFDELFRKYAPALTGYFMRRGQRAHDVQDLVQQTFLHLHRARHDYRPERPVRPWLFTIAHHLSCDLQRRRKRRPETFCDPDASEASPVAAADDGTAERARALGGALAQLPAAARTLLHEHWFEDRSWNQIASREGSNAGTLRVRAHRACVELRRLLEHSQFEFA